MSPAEKRLLMEVARQIRDDRKIEIDRLKDQAIELRHSIRMAHMVQSVEDSIEVREVYLRDFDEAIENAKSRKPEPYSTTQTESSFCPDCNEPVTLLSNGDRPQFYLCFDCKFVGEVGVGRVEPFKEPEEDDGEEES
jgi:hypothetical protein